MTFDTNTSQNMVALAKANKIRYARAALKKEVRAGKVTAASVVLDPPECADSMSIMELLTAQNRWGRTRARKLLYLAGGMYEGKAIQTMTTRQRRIIADLLEKGYAQL